METLRVFSAVRRFILQASAAPYEAGLQQKPAGSFTLKGAARTGRGLTINCSSLLHLTSVSKRKGSTHQLLPTLDAEAIDKRGYTAIWQNRDMKVLMDQEVIPGSLSDDPEVVDIRCFET